MGFLQLLSELFGGGSHDSRAGGRESAGPGTGVLPPPDEQPEVMPESELTGWWTPDGETTVVAPPLTGDERLVDRDLHDHLVRVLDDPDLALPRLPQIAQRALIMLHDPGVDFGRLAELIEQDPAVAAEVLRIANSVAYRGIAEVARLDLAFARLGSRTLRSIILALSTKGLMIQTGAAERSRGEELWQRALVSGIVLEQFSDSARLSRDEAFMLGLLHDIGMLAVLRVLHDYERTGGRRVPRPLFDRLCGEWHEHIGLRLADAWNLPKPLPDIIGNHHRDLRDDDPLLYTRSLVQFADVVCAMLEYAPYVPYDFFALPCVRRIGLQNDTATCRKLAVLPELIAQRIAGG